jgi:hypothetical protein
MKKQSIWYCIYVCIVLLIVIVLAAQPYFSLDEPNIMWSLRIGEAWSGYFLLFVSGGRQLYGHMMLNALELAGTFENFKYFRILTILLLFLFCWLFFYFLRKKNIQKSVAFFISVLIFSLPGFTVYIGWTLFYHCIAALLSLYAGMLVTAVFEKHLDAPALSKSKENVNISLAVVLQIISLFIYQGSALVFVVPAFITLLLHPATPAKKRIRFFAVTSFVFMICMVIYYKLFQSAVRSYNIPISERGKMGNVDVKSKLWFFTKVIKDASKLHLLLIKNAALSYIFSFGLVFLIIRDLVKKRFLDILFLGVFSLLLFFPHLIIVESWGASRNFVFISLIFVFYIVIRLFEMIPAFSEAVAACVGLAFIGIMCMNLGEAWVKPMKQNYATIREFASHLPDVTTDTLFVKFARQSLNMHEKKSFLKQYSDEFNTPVFFNDWAVEPGLKCLYQDTHPEIALEKINKWIKISEMRKTDSVHRVFDRQHFFLKLNDD